MSDTEKKETRQYYITKIEPTSDDEYFNQLLERVRKDAEQAQVKPEKKAPEKPKAQPVDTRKEEINRLTRVYCEKRLSLEKANKARWILTFCAFALVAFVVIMITMGNLTIEDVLQTNLQEIVLALFLAVVVTAIYFLINVSVFGWLIQKIIAADRELDPITKKIHELENTLNKGGDAKLN